MHEAAGEKVQKEKLVMLSCKWKFNQIVRVVINVITNGYIIKRIDVKHSIKTLGVFICPCLSWKDEFYHTKLKMKRSIKKLIIEDVKSHQVHLHFNTHMLTNVFFLDVG